MKLYKIIQSSNDCTALQTDLDRVVEWSSNWKIKLNIAKCKVIRLNGNENMVMPMYSIRENGHAQPLQKTDSEKDLGIKIDSHLNFDDHIAETVNKANRILGLIRRNFKDLNNSSFCALYKALVRSHLEYGQSVWSPYKLKHIDALEAVQRRATKILPSLKIFVMLNG